MPKDQLVSVDYLPYPKKHYAPGNILNGKKIKELREARGWSVEALAARTDLTPDNLNRLENNHGNTSTGKVRAIAKELNVNPAILIIGVEELITEAVRVVHPAQTIEEIKHFAFHPNRDVSLLRAFAGGGEAHLLIGDLKTPIPEEILGDILHVVAVHKLRTSNQA